MERKVGSSTVTEKELKGALGKARTLSAEEEKVVRMRQGAAADLAAPLPRAARGNAELEDELLVIEMQLMKAMRARTGQTRTASNTKPAAAAAQRVSTGAVNQTKDKIVRALRKKK
jgi:hypothetical protein